MCYLQKSQLDGIHNAVNATDCQNLLILQLGSNTTYTSDLRHFPLPLNRRQVLTEDKYYSFSSDNDLALAHKHDGVQRLERASDLKLQRPVQISTFLTILHYSFPSW